MKRNTRNRRVIYEVGGYMGSTAQYNQLRTRKQVSASWMWGCGFLTSLICVGGCLFSLVMMPIAFRALPDNLQNSIARRIPILIALLPPTETIDPKLEVVPTIDPARAATAAAQFGQPLTNPSEVLPGAVISATPILGPTRIPTQTATPRPTATSEPLPVAFYSPRPITREAQTWNNCGPANLVQGFRSIGHQLSQKEAASWLKPNDRDANVSPWQLAEFANRYTQARVVVRVNGTLELMKRLIYNGFGVIIETGLRDHEDNSWLGHYVTLVGWDDIGDANGGGFFYGLDTLEDNGRDGKGVHEHYGDLDERWKHFNRVYLVVYPAEQEGKLRLLLGTDWDERTNIEGGLVRSFQETKLNPNDPYPWFNIGTNYTMLGEYERATAAFDLSRATGSGWEWRMLWYQFGPLKAYYQVGRYEDVFTLANSVLGRVKYIEEIYYYRGLALAAMGNLQQARSDLQYAADFNPNFEPAFAALSQMQAGQVPLPDRRVL
ncbi:MAG: hypothetical protein OHK0023_18390 [Anaerolineae bacterium]